MVKIVPEQTRVARDGWRHLFATAGAAHHRALLFRYEIKCYSYFGRLAVPRFSSLSGSLDV